MQRLILLLPLFLASCATQRAPLASGDVITLRDTPDASGEARAAKIRAYGGFPGSGNEVVVDRPLVVEFD